MKHNNSRDVEAEVIRKAVFFQKAEIKRQEERRNLIFSAIVFLLFATFTIFLIKFLYITDVNTIWSSLASLSFSSSPEKSTKQSPNIVFLLIDDMGFDSIGYQEYDIAGSAPFLNSLVKDGILFTNYYAQEVCTPARAALLTGRYPSTVGIQYHLANPEVAYGLNITEVLLPEILDRYGGYKSYMVGKWHLGHHSPDYLPTARGFHEFIGYTGGEVYPWSKTWPSNMMYVDQLYSDANCFAGYNLSDRSDYSALFYTAKAQHVITQHNFHENPMFLYLAMQNVHIPFDDVGEHTNGLDEDIINNLQVFNQLKNSTHGLTRFNYALSLYMLDQGFQEIVAKLKDVGQLENTYFIVSSDNGGCASGGGRNGQLRGTKNTLWEGGLRVNAVLYSASQALVPQTLRGTNYTNLMHISDWFPTILGLVGLRDRYQPDQEHGFDGVDQSMAILQQPSVANTLTETAESTNEVSKPPREVMLYNLYFQVYGDVILTNLSTAVWAIRDSQFKLLHAYMNSTQSGWFEFYTTEPSDDDLARDKFCFRSTEGTLRYMLFDLTKDPNEITDIYDHDWDDNVVQAKTRLMSYLDYYAARAKPDYLNTTTSEYMYKTWNNSHFFILPWEAGNSKLKHCTPHTSFSILTNVSILASS